MNIREIVRRFLIEKEYDGLYNAESECCGCNKDDLMPCDEPEIYDCEAGYKHSNNTFYSEKEKTNHV